MWGDSFSRFDANYDIIWWCVGWFWMRLIDSSWEHKIDIFFVSLPENNEVRLSSSMLFRYLYTWLVLGETESVFAGGLEKYVQLVLIFSYNKNAAYQTISQISTQTLDDAANPHISPQSRYLHQPIKPTHPLPPQKATINQTNLPNPYIEAHHAYNPTIKCTIISITQNTITQQIINYYYGTDIEIR